MSKTIYLCGIGGSGMSALARYYLSEGYTVIGSDAHEGKITQQLQEEGATVFLGQQAQNLEGHQIDLFIYSEAIDPENPERKAAKQKGLEKKKYFQALGDISKNYYTIAVAGTHGKSSTTAMLGSIMRDAGLEVTAFVGARVNDWEGKNFLKANEGASDGHPLKKYLLIEACEYRESFLNIDVNGIVLTNVELDHLDYYTSPEQYFEAFEAFLKKLPQFGFFASFMEGDNIMNILPPNFHPRRFTAEEKTSSVPSLQIHGSFQRQNAACALAASEALKIDEQTAISTLEKFTGIDRRFSTRGEKDNILIIEDYAHHPTALRMTLESARDFVKKNSRKKLWVVFQPHQYSRTAEFFDDFCQALPEADEVLIPNIYEARDTDEDKSKVSPEEMVTKIEELMLKLEQKRSNVWGRGTRRRGEVFYKKQVRYTEDFETTLEILQDEAYDGDVVLVIGAGNVTEISDKFLGD